MANLDLKYKINIPFAEKGDRDEIPDTSPDGLVNNTDGLGVKYELEIPSGGEYYERQIFNGVVHKVYAAVKELQDLAISAGFPVDMTKALNVLSLEHGGLGANTAAGGRNNLGLGELAVLDTVDTDDIEDGAVTQAKLASSVVGNLPIGFIYFQLRGQSTPDVLFKTSGKWQDISSSFAGRFFRVAGGAAASFGNQQNGGIPNLYGIITGDEFGRSITQKTGVFQKSDNNSGTDSVGGGGGPCIRLIFDASSYNSLYGAATEVRPINETIRIWKKIS